jgi:hypothetical protein
VLAGVFPPELVDRVIDQAGVRDVSDHVIEQGCCSRN